jgi:hypothetical protein
MTIHDPKLDPKLDRRKLLAATGLGAASLFLPSLARRGAAQSAPPKRLVIMFSLHGTNYPNWRMRRTGLDENTAWEFPFDDADPNSFSEVLRPLHGVRQNLLVLDGIAQVSAIGDVLFNNHPKGRIHALTAAPFTRLNGEVATSTQASFDQVMAQRIRRADRLPSLELMGIGNDAFVYSGAGAAVPFEASPRAAFDRLFPGTSTPSPVSNAERIRGAQASVLDFVQGEFDVVKRRLSTEDQQKLDLHRDYIRDLELRLGNLSTVTCERPERPGNISTSDYQGRFDAFVRVAGAALACDLTRVVTFGMPQLSNAQAGAPPGDIHTDYAHHEAAITASTPSTSGRSSILWREFPREMAPSSTTPSACGSTSSRRGITSSSAGPSCSPEAPARASASVATSAGPRRSRRRTRTPRGAASSPSSARRTTSCSCPSRAPSASTWRRSAPRASAPSPASTST